MRHRPLPLGILILAIAAPFLISGCKTTYEMQVDAISNPAAGSDAESYIIIPRDPDTDTNDLRYKETVDWIKTALSGKGMYEALDAESADMVIQVDYGMEPPRREFKVIEEPVFASVRGPDEIRVIRSVDPKTGKVSTYEARVPGQVSKELIGYQERIVSVVVNEKYLELTAKENTLAQTGDGPTQEIWSVRVRNDDESDNLREYLPIMAASATDYIGEDTGTQQRVKVKEDDDSVVFVKRGLKNAKPIVPELGAAKPQF